MNVIASRRRHSLIARRFGYLLGVVVNTALLYAVNVDPGWQAVSFLTDDTRRVVPLVNVSLVAGVLAYLFYLASDATWRKPLGDLVTTLLSLAFLGLVWHVFPFGFAADGVPWVLVVRAVLAVSIGGTAIAAVVQLVQLVRSLPAFHGAGGGRRGVGAAGPR